ncbi:MAG: small-conductance mechanosensitive ion channel [Chloroflexi bacterium]|nr:small-conductance mechanosensitive ion channel [Chloroflexota bacterium]
MQPITDWTTAVITSIALALSMFVTAIPKVIGFLVILLIGWLISWAIGAAITTILRTIRFNDLGNRSGITTFVNNMGVRADPASFVAQIVKWFVRLVVLVVAFDALGLPAVSQVFGQMLAWLPNLIVGLVVLVIGGILASVVSDLVRGSTATAGLGNPELLSTIARIAIWAFAIVVAVNQIGIATTLVNTLFMAFVGALALAFGLAFGLGGRETASVMWQDWYRRSREAAPRVARAAENAERRMESERPLVGTRQGNRGESNREG